MFLDNVYGKKTKYRTHSHALPSSLTMYLRGKLPEMECSIIKPQELHAF